MAASASEGSRTVPTVAAALALAYLLGATVAPAALPAVTLASMLAGSAVVLARRRSHRLVATLLAICGGLTAGVAGACLLRSHPVGGLVWMLAVLFLLPLPLIPWLYSLTFPSNHDPRTTSNGERSER